MSLECNDPSLPREFAIIARYFRPLAGPGADALTDDVALVRPPEGRELVLKIDALVAGVHFLPDDPPDLIARKLLRVNLSDLAAKGATPLGYLLSLSAPAGTPEAFFAAFAAGLAADQAQYGVALWGGDTTSTPGPLSLALTAIGHVAPGTAPRRAGARAGDLICVTGTIGDGALGLRAARGELPDPTGHLRERYRLPQPRLGLPLAGLVSASMDVSDGLVQDLGHICRASGVAARLEAESVPLSPAARAAGPDWLALCLTGGDDYELLFAVPPVNLPALQQEAIRAGTEITEIGRFTDGAPAVTVLDAAGTPMALSSAGWSHF
jgi:thiamine-monophosphate kinase